MPPIPARSERYTAAASNRVWRNLPPARVWVYTRSTAMSVRDVRSVESRSGIGHPRQLIVGLDVASVEEARALVERIGDAGTFYKIGYQLAYAGGFASPAN